MKIRPIKRLLSLALLSTLSLSALAQEKTFYVGDPKGRDVVRFTSDAPLELINGNTSKISGKVSYDDAFTFDAKHPFKINVDVDLASLDTGIALRNEHMRDNFLQTAKFPKASFKVNKIKTNVKPPFKNGQVVNLLATGDFTLHGKTVQKTIPLKVTYLPESKITQCRIKAGNLIRIQGSFPVSLKEHGIPVPEMVFQKLAETVFVSIDTFGTDNPQAFQQ